MTRDPHRPPSRSEARPVAVWPCQSVCVWRATGEVWRAAGHDGKHDGEHDGEHDDHADLPVFACAGCGSEWVRTEPWTPIDAHGQVPDDVAAERRRSAGLTSGPGEASADSADT